MLYASPVIDKFVKARALIEDKDRWCQRHYFVVEADQQCMVGALQKAAGYEAESFMLVSAAIDTLAAAIQHLYPKWYAHQHEWRDPQCIVIQFNDTHAHRTVLRVLDEAIATAGE